MVPKHLGSSLCQQEQRFKKKKRNEKSCGQENQLGSYCDSPGEMMRPELGQWQ